MQRFELDTNAGDLSAELARQGVSATSRVLAFIEVAEEPDLPIAPIASSGGAFDWLKDEPDLYTASDIRPPR